MWRSLADVAMLSRLLAVLLFAACASGLKMMPPAPRSAAMCSRRAVPLVAAGVAWAVGSSGAGTVARWATSKAPRSTSAPPLSAGSRRRGARAVSARKVTPAPTSAGTFPAQNATSVRAPQTGSAVPAAATTNSASHPQGRSGVSAPTSNARRRGGALCSRTKARSTVRLSLTPDADGKARAVLTQVRTVEGIAFHWGPKDLDADQVKAAIERHLGYYAAVKKALA